MPPPGAPRGVVEMGPIMASDTPKSAYISGVSADISLLCVYPSEIALGSHPYGLIGVHIPATAPYSAYRPGTPRGAILTVFGRISTHNSILMRKKIAESDVR